MRRHVVLICDDITPYSNFQGAEAIAESRVTKGHFIGHLAEGRWMRMTDGLDLEENVFFGFEVVFAGGSWGKCSLEILQ